jgi:hypothetical protein
MDLDHVRSVIEHMRVQVGRQRKEILHLQRAGISTALAELLLGRMLAKIDGLCDERDRLKKEQGRPDEGARAWRPELVMAETLRWYDEEAESSPWDQRRLLNCASEPRVRATTISTSRRSLLRSTSTQRRRWAIAIIFSTSRMALAK